MPDDDRSSPSPEVESFFTLGGGGGNRHLQRLRLADGNRLHIERVAVVPFLPLVFLVVPAQEVMKTLARLLL